MFFSLILACTVHQGSGVAETRTYDLGSFTGIDNTTQVSVTWDAADAPAAALTCDDNLLDVYEVTVEDGTLRLSTPASALPNPQVDCELVLGGDCLSAIRGSGSGDITATASSCDLRSIDNSGSADISVAGVDTGSLSIQLSGSGGVDISGVAADAEIRTSGSGGVQGRSLETQAADIRMSSSADVHLTVTQRVDAKLSASGDLYIYGSPAQDSVSTSGSGDVFFR